MSNKIKVSLAIILLYFVFLIANFPASVAVNYAKSAQLLPKNIKLSGVSGSLWQGSLTHVTYQNVELDNVRWETSILPLLIGKLELDLLIGDRRSDIKADGFLSLSNSGISLTDFTLKSSIETLSAIKPLPLGLTATGKLAVKVDDFSQGQPWCNALSAQLTINNSVIRSPLGKLDVAKFTTTLTCPQGKLVAVTKKSKNSLGIDADVSIDKSKKYVVKATAVPPNDAAKEYIQLLDFSGKRNTQGQYIFNHNGRL